MSWPGVVEHKRSVLGRSNRLSRECRRGTPTVDAGEGGTGIDSIGSSSRSASWADRPGVAVRLDDCDVDLDPRKVLVPLRLREAAKEKTLLRLLAVLDSGLSYSPVAVDQLASPSTQASSFTVSGYEKSILTSEIG